MALYPKAIKKLIAPGPNDPKIKARIAILHVAVSEQPSLYAYFNGPSGGVESHFYVRRDGTVEQYRDTAYQADANTDANDFAISIETQGMASGQWTAAQLASIKALLVWCNQVHGIPLVKCPTWNGSGVGYHTQFPGSWDKRGASCPGPDRIKQFNNVLVPWMATGRDEADFMDVRNPLTDERWPAEKALWSIWTYAINAARDAAIARKLAEAAAAAGKPLTAAEIDDIAEATIAAFGKDYDAEITLTPKAQA